MQRQTFNEMLKDFGFDTFSELSLFDAENFARQLHAILTDKIEEIQVDLTEAESLADQWEGRYSNAQSEVESARENYDIAVESHQSEVQELESRISDLESDVSSLQAQLGD